ncbi:carboxylesterase family protein [Solihabitans fulvus]|uniref:Carboxylic ester hydrolase n=1 Tax=Solihabitans fulvus TaxID=1892852 RepID=A0A5B2WZ61_9PSEU|nr:carboxylesterase/lipase family protein [Solihabitans fulvus]KAA2256921.1 carboxylesterase family protein [Solihabitans fulvus]
MKNTANSSGLRRLARIWTGAAAIGLVLTAAGTAGAAVAEAGTPGSDPAVVVTDRGSVRGTVTEDHRSFQGIPYAKPPVGELRWRAPRPAEPWQGVRDATAPGSSCAQVGMPMAKASTSEDCLYLNVTTPRNASGRKLPVLFWMHGGSLAFGAGDLFGGAPLATKGDVVVVTINYRLGALGFLDHPALDGATPDDLSGNYGLQDQQAALRWVRDNAAAFGGDPRNVTLFGESAGSISTCAQLASPGAAGLFQRAISQSAPCVAPLSKTMGSYPRPRAAAEQQGLAIAARLGCDKGDRAAVAQCLHGRSTADIAALGFDYMYGFGLGPVVGGPVLPTDPAQAISSGHFNKVPMIVGTTHDEERFMVYGLAAQHVPLATDQDYLAQLVANFCDQGATGCDRADKVHAAYPLSAHDGSPALALSSVLTDSVFTKPAIDTDRALAAQVPTYAYEFADEQAPWLAGAPMSFPVGAYHTSELSYLFGVDWVGGRTAAQDALSDRMIRYWTQFARTGNPNAPGLPAWSRFHCAGQYVQSLAPGAIGRTDLRRDHQYDFWKSLG